MADTYSVPGLEKSDSQKVAALLQGRLNALIDTELTLKHVHWNVVGPSFIGVHEMIDPHVVEVREMVDAVAERIATLGGEPIGTPGFVAEHRAWKDYSIKRGSTMEHLAALDVVYNGLIADHRQAIKETGELDPVTEDLLIDQTGKLEQFQWFVRAHLEDKSGRLVTEGAEHLQEAAEKAAPLSAASSGETSRQAGG